MLSSDHFKHLKTHGIDEQVATQGDLITCPKPYTARV
jgi:hypothetical protein